MLRVPAVADVLNDMTTDVARYRQETPGANAVDASMDMVNARPGQSPSVEALHRALQELDASTSDRFLRLQDTALEQCQDSDDSDLRRLKKHFKTLKNTFTVYDLKEGFIEGLLQGLPDGTEEDKLWSFEEDMERNSVLLRQYKSNNEQAQAQMVNLMEDIAQARQIFTAQRDGCAAQLDALAEEQAEYAQEQMQLIDHESADFAALQAECLASLRAETALQESCEAALASHQADIQEMDASISSAAQELQLLQAQIAAAEAGQTAARQESETNHRFVAHAEWCDQMLSVVSALSGVSIVSNDEGKLVVNMTTNIPTGVNEDQPGSRPQHTLELCFSDANSTIQKATLQPADVEIDSIVKVAAVGRQGVSFVVREVQAAIRGHVNGQLHITDERSSQ